ncbi:hypothetical protein GCM10011331_01080 [Flavimobilis marinus]|uniref:N-acetylmuramoyl-L-alanine amidase n=1 Tax=Flavimobilis marinus TaxID=285351 RepID=A0A1I2E6M9_9MICO|nr:peptidoglycan recognition protein [Flavimobilis marinus]GHG43607.1 hypothetical protein GCM10011331_01080 [Flavimobilis marinus]SFE88128.1 N-acetylmuramoyl-L-alanine amidase [Flavimobilis marinus]
MRPVLAALLTGALTVVGLAVPVVALPVAAAEPVEAEFASIALDGVDTAAAKDASVAEEAVNAAPDAAAESALRDSSDDLVALSSLESTEPFMVAGVTWDGTAEDVTEVAVRVREQGEWTDWTELEVENTGVEGERAGTSPVLSAGADGIQARVRTHSGRAPAGLQIDLVDPGSSRADGARAGGPAATANAATGYEIAPQVVTRAQWGADESKAGSWPQLSAGLSAMYVHHTAGTNSYTEAQAAALVRGIYGFHTGSRGWPDIGYQFLVDKYGNIYQGRQEAIHDLPIGAQAGGYNTSTIGISALGNYETAEPTAALQSALVKVLGWKAYQYGLNATGTTRLYTGSSTGSTVRAKAGSTITVPVILGHRDTNYTACPGKNLYAKMPSIRQRVAERVSRAKATHGSSVAPGVGSPSVVQPGADQAPVQTATSSTYRWSAVPGAARYEILTRSGSHGYAMDDSRSWIRYGTVSGTQATISISPGQTRLVMVRAIDGSGRRSAAVRVTQSTAPVSASALAWSSGWTKESGAGHTIGALRSTATAGRTLRVDNVKDAAEVRIYGEAGPGYGATQVLLGDRVIGEVRWDAATVDPRAVRALRLPGPVSGKVRLRTTSAARVAISTLAFPRESAPASPTPSPSAPVALGRPVLDKSSTYDFPGRLSQSITFRWKPVAGASSYRLEVRKAKHGKGFGRTIQAGSTTGTSISKKIKAGETWYVKVRAVAADGTVSAASAYPKVTRPVGRSTLKRTSGTKAWSKSRHTGYYGNFAWSTTNKGAKLSVDGASDVRTVQVVAARGKGYGRMAVYVGGKRVGTINTAATRLDRTHRYTVKVGGKRSGRVTLKALDQGKPVRVSVIVAAR